MKKFEEELNNGLVTIGQNIITKEYAYGKCALINYFKDWVSPEDHQAEIAKLNSKIDWLHGLLDERNEEVLQTVKLLNEAQPEIPEVPQFVADWYEENKGSLDYMIFETCRNLTDESTDEFENWFDYDNNKAITTLVNMKNGYTVKDKLFYLKHIEMSKRDVHHDYYAQIRNERFEHDSVESGKLPQPVITGVTFTQQEIDSMETGSYEQIEVEE